MRPCDEITIQDHEIIPRTKTKVRSIPLLPKNWPTTVSCEMNVDEWSRALRDANLMKDFGDVLEGFTVGFDQGKPHHTVLNMKFFTPDNHASSYLAAEKIEKNMKEEVEK